MRLTRIVPRIRLPAWPALGTLLAVAPSLVRPRYRAALVLVLLVSACSLEDLAKLAGIPIPQASDDAGGDTAAQRGFVIDGLTPDRGAPRGLELVEIHGNGFEKGAIARFGGAVAVDTVVASTGLIYATTPPHPAARVAVTVTNPNGALTRLDGAFVYESPSEILAVVPAEGPASGGYPIELRGIGFLGVEVVLVGGREALMPIVVDDHTLYAIAPAGVAGPTDVIVVGREGRATRRRDAFRYVAPPEVTGLMPLVSPPEGGGTLALTGSALFDEASVAIGTAPAPLLASTVDGSRLVVRVPPGTVGRHALRVSTRYGGVELPNAFAYAAPRTALDILGVWPPAGPASGGNEVLIAASGLVAGRPVAVRFGDHEASVASVQVAQGLVLALAPPGVANAVVAVTLSRDGETRTLTDAYRYAPVLRADTVEPSSGPATGGTPLVVRGAGFSRLGAAGEVRLGALPLANVTVVSDTELRATTPTGSPGRATLRLTTSAGTSSVLPDAFDYRAGQVRVHAITPDHGGIAGNTLVRVYGTDLPADVAVRFGDLPATQVEWLSPTLLHVRTARAPGPMPTDVTFTFPDGSPTQILWRAFSYLDPTARYPGTSGEPLEGSLNVTVLDDDTDDPIPGAVVVLGSSDPPQYKGYTDDRGQVTLSGPALVGRVDVSTTKAGYTASSVIDFDAEHVTLTLIGPSQPSDGPPKPQLPPGRIEGRVEGIGKYLRIPYGRCDELADPLPPPGFCAHCQQDSDCAAGAAAGASACVSVEDQDPFCTATCVTNADCPEMFVCANAGKNATHCVPRAGMAEVRCHVTTTSLFSSDPVADENARIDLAFNEPNTFTLSDVRLGESAVYCIGGAARMRGGLPDFLPLVLGVARHVTVQPGPQTNPEAPPEATVNPPTQVTVTLDIPLLRSIRLSLEEPPLAPGGPDHVEVKAWIDLGSDGYVPLLTRRVAPTLRELTYRGMPKALSGVLYDAQYRFYAGALSSSDDTLPSSEVLRSKLGALDDGTYLVRTPTGFEARASGYPGNLLDAVALGPSSVFATSESGTVLHWDGKVFATQPVPTGPALRAVAPDLRGGLIAVGDKGRVLRFDGIGWTAEPTGLHQDLRDVVALGPESAVAVGAYVIATFGSGTWTLEPLGPPKDLRALSRAGAVLVAAGAGGVVLERPVAGGAWVPRLGDWHETLHGAWATSDGVAVLVGERGRILLRDGAGTYTMVSSPTTQALHAVVGRSAQDVWAVGDAATVVHFDGTHWTLESIGVDEAANVSLRAIVGLPPTLDGLVAVGAHAVHLGPFVTPPTFVSPKPYGLWDQRTLQWTAQGGDPATFHAWRLYAGSTGLFWSIMAPGWLDRIHLPDFRTLEGIPTPPEGPKMLLGYRVAHPKFSIDSHDARDMRLSAWRGWSIVRVEFDGATPDPKDATVPGQ